MKATTIEGQPGIATDCGNEERLPYGLLQQVRGGPPFPAAMACKNPALKGTESTPESRFLKRPESAFGHLEKE
jgi:hypothetical protein